MPITGNKDMSGGTLRIRTLSLLRERPRIMTYDKLATLLAEYGVSVTWLHNFISNKTKLADVDKVQALYELLSKSKLELK